MAPPPPPTKRRVNVPIKIEGRGARIDGERLSEHLAERAGEQLNRALDVLDERGPWRPELAPLEIEFTGAAARLSDEEKRALYTKVSDGLTKAAQRAQGRRGSRGPRGKRPGQGAPAEKNVKPKVALKSVSTWHEFERTDAEAFRRAFHAAASAWLEARGLKVFPSTYGILFRVQGASALWLVVVHGGEFVCQRELRVVDWSGKEAKSEPAELEADATDLHLLHEPDGLTKWRQNAYKNRATKRGIAEKKVGQVTAEKDVSAPARAHSVEAEDFVNAYTKDWETTIRVFYRLKVGRSGGLYPFAERYFPKMPTLARIELIPLVERVDAELSEEELAALSASGVELPASAGGERGEGGRGADKGAGSGSDVTAPPGQDVGEGGRGVVIAPEYKKGGSIFPLVPSDPNAKSAELACEPYQDEPSVDVIPSGGAEMRALIAEIAARLDMAPCPWPAHFCIQASRMIRIRTSQVQARFALDDKGDFSAELSVGTLDASGSFVFRALDSVAVQYLQHLAGTIPKIRALMELVRIHTYPVTRFGPHHWFEDVAEEATQASGLIWLCANQIMMQQLLNSSRHAVEQRKGNAEYTRLFAAVCQTQLADQVEQIMLRTALERFLDIVGARRGAEAYAHVREHMMLQAALEAMAVPEIDTNQAALLAQYGQNTDLVTRLTDQTEYVFRRGRREGIADAGAIVEREDGKWGIRASDGTLYTKEELSRQLQFREQLVLSIDPLISQLVHRLVTAVRPLVEDPTQIPGFLEKLFGDMLAKNDEVSRKNRGDIEYAFEHAQIHKVDRSAKAAVEIEQVTVLGWSLSGTHALAHLHVGARFEYDAFYTYAVNRLIGQEYYWRSFVEDMIFVFGIALTVICPPIGAAVSFLGNLALGVEAYNKAKEQEAIHGAQINPEQVLSYAEIQVDLFVAKLQIGLSFLELLPGLGKGAKALTGLGKRAVRQTAGRGLRKLAKEVVMEELERIAKLSAENFAKALALELVEETVEDKIVDMLVGPIIEDQIRQLERELHEEGLL